MVIKPTEMMTPMHSVIAKVFPKMKMIFNTRHPRQSMISYLHTAQSEKVKPMFKYQYHGFYNACLPFDYESEELQELRSKLVRESRVTSIIKSFAYKYGGVLDFYFKHKDLCCCYVLFEDLLADPEGEIKRLFQALDLPEALVPLSLKALKTHSQDKFFGDPLKDKREKEFNDHDLEEINEAFYDLKLPLDVNMSVEKYKKLF